MPELPEVETVRRGLAQVLEGRRLARVAVNRPDLRIPFPENFAERLQGRRVERLDRRAKYLLLPLDSGEVLLGHLGMSGRMLISARRNVPPGRHDHVILETDEGIEVVFCDPRRFGLMTLIAADALERHPLLAALGPEPLGEAFTGAVLTRALAGRNTSIKAALLDQRVVAGLGNIYVSEALFRAGIHPERAAGQISAQRLTRLVGEIKAVLEDAIAAGGSTLRDHVRPDGELGYFQHSFKVYGREGEPCPGCDCGRGITRIVQGGRSTFFCAKRQR